MDFPLVETDQAELEEDMPYVEVNQPKKMEVEKEQREESQ